MRTGSCRPVLTGAVKGLQTSGWVREGLVQGLAGQGLGFGVPHCVVTTGTGQGAQEAQIESRFIRIQREARHTDRCGLSLGEAVAACIFLLVEETGPFVL